MRQRKYKTVPLSKRTRTGAYALIALFLLEICFPTAALALTGGPSQPEVQSFMPVSVSDMVDLSSGDFHYNIPLMNVGDYPVNLIYNGGITVDQEASWVGLGWNLNPGVINRQMKSVPDDFKGDKIVSRTSSKTNSTYGISLLTPNIEFAGFSFFNLSYSLGINYNNYTGINFMRTIGVGMNLGHINSGEENAVGSISLSSGLDGPLSIRPDLSLRKRQDKVKKKPTRAKKREANDDALPKDKKLNVSILPPASTGGLSLASFLTSNNSSAPTVSHPMRYTPLSLRVALGPGIFLLDGQTIQISGFYNEQKTDKESVYRDAFGYNYLEYADIHSMMDYNRENEVAYNKKIPYLPSPVIGYDSYIVNGEGIGGMFRPHRSDFGSLHDAKVYNGSVGGNLALELDVGNLVDVGFDVQVNAAQSTTSGWTTNNDMDNLAKFRVGQLGQLFEPFYFKFLGDMPFDPELEGIKEDFMGESPVRVEISNLGGKAKSTLQSPAYQSEPFGVSYAEENYDAGSYPKRPLDSRVKRGTMISALTADKVTAAGVTGWKNAYSKKHHMAEISVTQPSGKRYIYGRPAYNISQTEMQFNVSNQADLPEKGQTIYSPTSATTSNSNGQNEHFSSKTVPPYAHSYFITAILSDDYTDYDNIKGPSKNDYGSYTKFNYDAPYSYAWRTPFLPNQANLNEGVISRDDDDMGAVVEGVKEIHYVRSIESKTQIAVFTASSQREDAYGAGFASQMKQLDKINLYSLEEYQEDPVNAVPIKTVHFEYAHQVAPEEVLCKNIENGSDNNSDSFFGKLTLKRVYFTYGNSNLGARAPYEFEYSDLNPDYHPLAYDMWGNYKYANDPTIEPQPSPQIENGNPSGLYNSTFPYLPQAITSNTDIKGHPHNNAKAWNLSKIHLPSGGTIEIELESDQYTHVQDKRAMQMVKIAGVSESQSLTETGPESVKLYDGNTPYRYIHFEIPQNQYSSGAQFIQRCVLPLHDKPVYFNFSVDVLDQGFDKDRVKGYFQIVQSGHHNDNHGWIKVKNFSMQGGIIGGQANPISQAAWNYAKLHHPKKAYGFPEMSGGGDPLDFILALANTSLIGTVTQVITGPDHRMRESDFGKVCAPNQSWFRVLAAEKGKYGGGHRVREIRLIDNWSTMTEDDGATTAGNAAYGQRYTYLIDGTNKSSGVATFEPSMSQENPFIEPAFYQEASFLIPGQNKYLEGPIGKSLFPSPKVTYSYVKVESLFLEETSPGSFEFNDLLNPTDDSAPFYNHTNGYTTHEFFTSRDFPTKSSATAKDLSASLPTSLIGNLFNFYTSYWESASQGFYVETNDMNGKMKAQSNYDTDGILISRTENVYQTKGQGGKELDNNVLMIDDDLSYTCEETGVNFDLYHDFKENKSLQESAGLQPNVGSFILGLFPALAGTVLPDISVHKTRLSTASTMKVIHKHGILQKVKTFNQGAEVITENLAYDRESGEVLVSSVTNEYDQTLYSFAYPAHWKYDRMGGAYKNEGYTVAVSGAGYDPTEFEASQTETFITALTGQDINALNHLYPGDEVAVTFPELEYIKDKAWVYQPEGSSLKYLIDEDGNALNKLNQTLEMLVQVVRSGNRNMQGMAMGSLTMSTNPLGSDVTPKNFCENSGEPGQEESGQIQLDAPETQILAASATTYRDNWKTLKGTGQELLECSVPIGFEWEVELANFLQDLAPFIASASGNFTLDFSSPPFDEYTTMVLGSSPLIDPEYFVINDFDPIDPNATASISFAEDFVLGALLYNTSQGPGSAQLFSGLGLCSEDDEEGFSSLQEFFDDSQGIYFAGFGTNVLYYVIVREDFSYDFFYVTPQLKGVPYKPEPPLCPPDYGNPINPYVAHLRGKWRQDDGYSYVGDREYTYSASATTPLSDIRNDGYFDSNFEPYWNYTLSEWTESSNDKWVGSERITDILPYKTAVESKDALNRFSASVYGYNHQLPVCVAQNATYQKIGFDSFEDYDSWNCGTSCQKRHFAFEDYSSEITEEEAHTGYKSIKVEEGEKIATLRKLESQSPDPTLPDESTMPYFLQEENDIGLFGPETYDVGAFAENSSVPSPPLSEPLKFLLSYWVKERPGNLSKVYDFSYDEHEVEINIEGVEVTYGSESKSPVIEEWQRVEREFFIPAGAIGDIEINIFGAGEFGNPLGGSDAVEVFVDDIRVHPFNAGFKSFTYDPVTFRLMAELDENNFATFYEYDDTGGLVRVKKETEKGIYTLKEHRKDYRTENPTP